MVVGMEIEILNGHHGSLFHMAYLKRDSFQKNLFSNGSFHKSPFSKGSFQMSYLFERVSFQRAHLKRTLIVDHSEFRFPLRWPFRVSAFQERAVPERVGIAHSVGAHVCQKRSTHIKETNTNPKETYKRDPLTEYLTIFILLARVGIAHSVAAHACQKRPTHIKETNTKRDLQKRPINRISYTVYPT